MLLEPPVALVDPKTERNTGSVDGWVIHEEMIKSKTMVHLGEAEEGDIAVEVEEDNKAEEEEGGDVEVEEGFYAHEVHDMGRIRMVGGISFINLQTILFCDLPLQRILNSDERWRAYLQFHEEAFQIAAAELVSSYGSPRSVIANGNSTGCTVDKISKKFHLSEKDIQLHNNDKKDLLQTIVQTRRRLAYRKDLLKLDFIQLNSDPEDVLERLRYSKLWSELSPHERRLGLEYENLALEKINLELGSELQKHLDDSDWRLMNQYYNRKKLVTLARECAIQAEATKYILCEQALPLRSTSMEQVAVIPEYKSIKSSAKQSLEGALAKRLPNIKLAVNQSLEGSMRRVGDVLQNSIIARSKAWQLKLACAVTALTLATAGDLSRR